MYEEDDPFFDWFSILDDDCFIGVSGDDDE